MLQIIDKSTYVPNANIFIEWINKISQYIEIKQDSLTIRVVSAEESQALNQQFRQIDKPTNVLSFPADLPDFIEAPYLGDIVICATIIEQEAKAQNKGVDDHWAHMLVHGVLHLKGYDHISDDEAEQMEALEIKLLKQINVANPYA